MDIRSLDSSLAAALRCRMRPPFLVLATAVAWLCAVASSSLRAQINTTLETRYAFAASSDGSTPNGPLVQGSDGSFYGTTLDYAAGTYGTIYKITPAGQLTTLYRFTGGSDGARPMGGLTVGADGFFYGVTYGGGIGGAGTVFQVTADGALTTLHSFAGNTDGINPPAGLARGTDGNFYGVTSNFGPAGVGTAFRITPSGEFTVLHGFTGYSDGAFPCAALVRGSDGNFYGTTSSGRSGTGALFKMTPDGVLTSLYVFTGGADGLHSLGALAQGLDGNFYGPATDGGTTRDGSIFKLTPDGVFTTVYSFTGGTDGAQPQAGLIRGSDGKFYGTTSNAEGSEGTIFQLTPAGVLTTLHRFTGSSDGSEPNALVQSNDGVLYGTNKYGGPGNAGTIFAVYLDVPTPFFNGAVALANGVYYLAFPNGNYFGYYSLLSDPRCLYHFDLGYEYVFDANDGKAGVYLYDFASSTFFYTSPTFPFPYLYDFSLNTVLYYYPDPNNAGRYNTAGRRLFYRFDTGEIITK